MSGRSSLGDLIPHDLAKIFAHERHGNKGRRRRRGGSLSRAFRWLKGRKKKAAAPNGQSQDGRLGGARASKQASPQGQAARLDPEGTLVTQPYQQNVFIEGNRTKYLEDLHSEAQEALKLQQQEENKAGVDYQDDQSVTSTVTMQTDMTDSFSQRRGSLESESTMPDSASVISSRSTRSSVSQWSTRSGLTRQASTFRPLNSGEKETSKTRRRHRRTTVMGIPQHVQKELGLDRAAWAAGQTADRQLPNGGGVNIPTVDGMQPGSAQEGARVQLQSIEVPQVSSYENVLKSLTQAGHQDDLALLHPLDPRLCLLQQGQVPLAAHWGATATGLLQQPPSPVVSMSPQAPYLSKIIPNAVLPPSVDVVEISRNRSRSSVRTISKSSLVSASPAPSRTSRVSSRYNPLVSDGSGWSRSGSSETLVSDSSTISSGGATPIHGSEVKEGGELSQGGGLNKASMQLNAATRANMTNGKARGDGGKQGPSVQSLSILKTKKPPAPPSRSYSLNKDKLKRQSRGLEQSAKCDDEVPQNQPSQKNGYKMTISPYSTQGGTVTVTPTEISNPSPGSKRDLHSNLKNIYTGTSLAPLDPSLSFQQFSDGNQPKAYPQLRTPSRLACYTVTLSPTAVTHGILEIPPPPKVMAPPPPPPEVWSHNMRSLHLLCGFHSIHEKSASPQTSDVISKEVHGFVTATTLPEFVNKPPSFHSRDYRGQPDSIQGLDSSNVLTANRLNVAFPMQKQESPAVDKEADLQPPINMLSVDTQTLARVSPSPSPPPSHQPPSPRQISPIITSHLATGVAPQPPTVPVFVKSLWPVPPSFSEHPTPVALTNQPQGEIPLNSLQIVPPPPPHSAPPPPPPTQSTLSLTSQIVPPPAAKIILPQAASPPPSQTIPPSASHKVVLSATQTAQPLTIPPPPPQAAPPPPSQTVLLIASQKGSLASLTFPNSGPLTVPPPPPQAAPSLPQTISPTASQKVLFSAPVTIPPPPPQAAPPPPNTVPPPASQKVILSTQKIHASPPQVILPPAPQIPPPPAQVVPPPAPQIRPPPAQVVPPPAPQIPPPPARIVPPPPQIPPPPAQVVSPPPPQIAPAPQVTPPAPKVVPPPAPQVIPPAPQVVPPPAPQVILPPAPPPAPQLVPPPAPQVVPPPAPQTVPSSMPQTISSLHKVSIPPEEDRAIAPVPASSTTGDIPLPPPLPVELPVYKPHFRSVSTESQTKEQPLPNKSSTEETHNPVVTASLLQMVRLRSVKSTQAEASVKVNSKPGNVDQSPASVEPPQKPIRKSLILNSPPAHVTGESAVVISHSDTVTSPTTLTNITSSVILGPTEATKSPLATVISSKITDNSSPVTVTNPTQTTKSLSATVTNPTQTTKSLSAIDTNPTQTTQAPSATVINPIETTKLPPATVTNLTLPSKSPPATIPSPTPIPKSPPAMTPSMRMQEAIRLKTEAMSSKQAPPSRLSLHFPLSPTGEDIHKSPSTIASFIFSKSTKKIVIETPPSPVAQANFKRDLMAQLASVSVPAKSTDAPKTAVKTAPPVAKKPKAKDESVGSEQPKETEPKGETEHVQTAGQETQPDEPGSTMFATNGNVSMG